MLLFPSYIKLVVWVVFILSGIGLLLIYTLPEGSFNPGKHRGPLTKTFESGQVTGMVKDFGSNRNGDVDELLINNTDGDTWLHFPPHTARQIIKFAPKGSQVVVLVNNAPLHPYNSTNKAYRYQVVQLQKGDAVLFIEDIPPPPPAVGQPIELNGPIDSLITGEQGEVLGLVVNNYRIALPPHLAQSIAPLLHQGMPVMVKGYERNSEDGFVNTDKRKLVKPYRMTIDGTDYLL